MEQSNLPSQPRSPAAELLALAGWDFRRHARQAGCSALLRGAVTTLQVNMGRLCNQACRHCHVGAGPNRTERLTRSVAERLVTLLRSSPGVQVLDLTGGAPELSPSFRWLVTEARALGCEVIDRCNLTVLLEPELRGLDRFLADQGVHIVASLPCYGAENVDAQRGSGVFECSVQVLQRLNRLGYGDPAGSLRLDLVYNPGGAFLPPPQGRLESDYKQKLAADFDIRFGRLLTLTNLPIRRFADDLMRRGNLAEYMQLLVQSFNPVTIREVMCRSLVSVAHDGKIFDCDFNQMLDLSLGAAAAGVPSSVFELQSLAQLQGHRIATAGHCFGCTAGAGSSCGGALAEAAK